MGYMEFTAKNVNDAIMKASIQLATSSEDLDIKVVSEGSSGFLGIGSKPAIIRVCKKVELEPEVKIDDKADAIEIEDEIISEKIDEEVKVEQKTKTDSAGLDEIKLITQEFLNNVFKAMDMVVEMKMSYSKSDKSLEVEFVGEDMGILIGKRGQTLDSLQYLTNLVVNKEQQDYVRVKLDTENYRKRRKETLENLARNISYKVKKTRRPVALEPMNPYERRIIHSALQGNKFVETYSEGNEPYRHVVVTLKK